MRDVLVCVKRQAIRTNSKPMYSEAYSLKRQRLRRFRRLSLGLSDLWQARRALAVSGLQPPIARLPVLLLRLSLVLDASLPASGSWGAVAPAVAFAFEC